METNVEAKFSASPVWHNNFEYRVEKERGFDWHEDLFCPGAFEIPVREGDSLVFSAATVASAEKPDEAWTREEARRADEAAIGDGVAKKMGNEKDRADVRSLIAAGRQFSINSPSGRPAIIAGYHWFGDWGRDTLISLPGLTFLSGRPEEGMAILAAIGAYEKDGLLPNYFSDDETENAYNTVDTSSRCLRAPATSGS